MGTVVGSVSGSEYDLARCLALYDLEGDLPARARDLWSRLEQESIEMAREFWRRYARSPELSVPFDINRIEEHSVKVQAYIELKFAHIADPEWTRKARSYVERALTGGLTLSTLLAGVSAETEAAFSILRRQVNDEAELVWFARTLSEVQAVEVDCFIHHAIQLARGEGEKIHSRRANDFNGKVLGMVQNCTQQSEGLRSQASATSASARGMLGKTSEVAAAAEQSATAMREAAQTAAGLIRA
ncbi:MAG: hypothetical protein ABIN83_00430, partial [Sphingomicrobium sp.]